MPSRISAIVLTIMAASASLQGSAAVRRRRLQLRELDDEATAAAIATTEESILFTPKNAGTPKRSIAGGDYNSSQRAIAVAAGKPSNSSQPPPPPPPQLFVLLGGWRTGSTWLATMLDAHPAVAVKRGEWFMQSRHGLDRLGWADARAPTMRPLWEHRFDDPAPYLRAAIDAERERLVARRRRTHGGMHGGTHGALRRTAIGHKFQLGYLGAPPGTKGYMASDASHMSRHVFRRTFLDDGAWLELLLYRCDVLAQWVSYWWAAHTHNWKDAPPRCRGILRFDLPAYLDFKFHQDRWSSLIAARLASRRACGRNRTTGGRLLPFRVLRYERDLLRAGPRERTLRGLFGLLGVAEPPPSPQGNSSSSSDAEGRTGFWRAGSPPWERPGRPPHDPLACLDAESKKLAAGLRPVDRYHQLCSGSADGDEVLLPSNAPVTAPQPPC